LSIYADTSFFVSLYVPDQHTPEARRRLASRPALWMTPLHVAEWVHAIEQHVFRKAISRSEADRSIQLFHDDRKQGLWREVAVPERAFEVLHATGSSIRGPVRGPHSGHTARGFRPGAEGGALLDL